jgi:hypothetical protein
MQLKRYLSDRIIPEGQEGYEQGQEIRYPVFTEANRKELSYLSSELDRLEKRMKAGVAAATIIMNRFDPLEGHLASLRDNLKNNSQLSQPARVRLLISRIKCDHLGSIDDAIQAVDDLIHDTGMAATPSEVRTLVTRLTALFEERRDYQRPGESPMPLSDFRRFFRKRLGTDAAGQFHRLVEKALEAVDGFEQRPVDPDGHLGETESAAIDRMMGIVQNIVGAERPVTKQEAPSGAEGNTATRGPSTAHSAVIAPPHDIGRQENYHQGFMAGLAAAAFDGGQPDPSASIQRVRREKAGTTGYGWTGGAIEPSQPCRQYQRHGSCSWGDRCKYRHDGQASEGWQHENTAMGPLMRQRQGDKRSRSRGSHEQEEYGTRMGYYGQRRRTRSRSTTSADSGGAPPTQSTKRSGGDTPGGDRRGGGGRSK